MGKEEGNGHSRKGLGITGFIDTWVCQLTWVSPHLLCLARRVRVGEIGFYIHWLIMDPPNVLSG